MFMIAFVISDLLFVYYLCILLYIIYVL